MRAPTCFDGSRFLPGGATVLVAEGLVAGVEPFGYDVPDGCPVVSYAGTLLPGLVDAHVHLVTDSGPEALSRVAGYTDEEIDDVVTEALRRHLAAGVTTVRDLGDRRYTWSSGGTGHGRRRRRSRASWPPGRRSPSPGATATSSAARRPVPSSCGRRSASEWSAASTW